jgi:hypothetical protein
MRGGIPKNLMVSVLVLNLRKDEPHATESKIALLEKYDMTLKRILENNNIDNATPQQLHDAIWAADWSQKNYENIGDYIVEQSRNGGRHRKSRRTKKSRSSRSRSSRSRSRSKSRRRSNSAQ